MAHPDWKSIDIDTVLNVETANTAEMARFGRILQHRNAEATINLAKQMQGVSITIHRASELAESRAERVIPKLDIAISKADEAIAERSKLRLRREDNSGP